MQRQIYPQAQSVLSEKSGNNKHGVEPGFMPGFTGFFPEKDWIPDPENWVDNPKIHSCYFMKISLKLVK